MNTCVYGRLAVFFSCFFVLASPILSPCVAGEAEDIGFAIAKEVHRRNQGFIDFTVKMRMDLRNQAGKSSIRYLRSRTLEGVKGQGDRSLLIFHQPSDVKGTALLTLSRVDDVDDQWMYLPDMRKRVKRIAAGNRAGSFMGSEFSFEDLAPPVVDKFTYKYLRDEACGKGAVCFLNERLAKDKYSGYSRQWVWIDKKEYRPWRVDYFDRKGELLKTLRFSDYKLHERRFWRAHTMQMMNHQTGKSTTLYWSRFRFGVGLREGMFDSTKLDRIR